MLTLLPSSPYCATIKKAFFLSVLDKCCILHLFLASRYHYFQQMFLFLYIFYDLLSTNVSSLIVVVAHFVS